MSEETQADREAIAVYAPEAAETERVPPRYKQTEVGVIPGDWEALSVGSMGEVVAGKALAAKAPGLQRPYLRTKNVFDGLIDIDDVLSMPMTDEEFARYELRDGDVLLNEGQSLELVGRCSIYRSEFPEPCAIQNQLIRFRARSGVSPAFAAHLFRYCQKAGVFAQIALQTTSVAHLGVSRFQNLMLAWPVSEAEQHVIAAALSDVDDLISSLGKLISKKRAVKTAAMQQLLTGKQRLPGFSGEWEVRRLGEVARIAMGRTPSRAVQAYWGRGYPWLSIANLNAKYLTDTKEEITATAAADMRVIPEGTLVMSFKLTIGKLAFTGRDMYSNEAICSFNDLKADAEFLYHILGRTDFSLYGKQAVKGYTLNTESLNAVEIPYPTLEEQTAIATVLSDMDAEISALEARREKTQQVKQGMMQELLRGRTRLIRSESST